MLMMLIWFLFDLFLDGCSGADRAGAGGLRRLPSLHHSGLQGALRM